MRKSFFAEQKNAWIGYYEAIYTCFFQAVEMVRELMHVTVMSKNIECHINFYSPLMGVGGRLFHFWQGKISSTRAKTVVAPSEIHRICTIMNGCNELLHVASRSEQFWDFLWDLCGGFGIVWLLYHKAVSSLVSY
nr:hypothetical protein [Candidatus Electrothrix aestuarii]